MASCTPAEKGRWSIWPHQCSHTKRYSSSRLSALPCCPLPHCSSVPSGRVGNSKDAIFRSNEHFREAVAEREAVDVAELEVRELSHTGRGRGGWLANGLQLKEGVLQKVLPKQTGLQLGRALVRCSTLQARLGRRLDKAERARIGVGQLRRFLEQLLQRRCVVRACPQHWAAQLAGLGLCLSEALAGCSSLS